MVDFLTWMYIGVCDSDDEIINILGNHAPDQKFDVLEKNDIIAFIKSLFISIFDVDVNCNWIKKQLEELIEFNESSQKSFFVSLSTKIIPPKAEKNNSEIEKKFNFTPNAEAKAGQIVTGCMVVNQFDGLHDLENNDADAFLGLFSNRENIIILGENRPKNNQRVALRDCDEFIRNMKGKIKDVKNISAFVIYIRSHGELDRVGEQLIRSDNISITITEFLEKIFVGDDEWEDTSSIPKIIFVDTCIGSTRNQDIYKEEKPYVCENQAKGTIKTAEQEGGKIYQRQGTKNPKKLENFIIIHASAQQNYSYQNKFGSKFLKVLQETIEQSSSEDEDSLDIMKLSFNLVNNIGKLPDFADEEEYEDYTVYNGQVKLMCEADVHLNENFSLRMRGRKIDSDVWKSK